MRNYSELSTRGMKGTSMANEPSDVSEEPQWPNQMPVVDGVEPMSETSQDPDFIDDDEDDDLEMEE